MLALARQFAEAGFQRTVRFVAFTNEEPPFIRTTLMGSRVYARRCRERNENIVGMISIETVAFYAQERGSQRLSLGDLVLPSRGNFIALVANSRSGAVLSKVDAGFQQASKVPTKPLTLPTNIPGAWSSDLGVSGEKAFRA